MVELLFEKGFIRLLIATETFAVGINMPTKTVIFAGLSKFNGNTMRLLFPHEYTQMAGRAGRRGKDVVGHVFHCVNLFELPTLLEYKHMLTGPPQTLTSKFKISFNTALAMLECNQDMSEFMSQSLLSLDLKRELKYCEQAVVRLTETVESKQEQIALCRTPEHILRIYKTIFDKLPHMVNGDRKAARKELAMMEDLYKFILPDLLKIDALKTAQEAVDKAQIKKENTLYYVENTILSLTIILTDCGFMGERLVPTLKGRIAAQLQETHPLAMADLYLKTEKFASFSAARLAGLFSCFYPVHVSDEYKAYDPPLSLREAVKILYGDMTDYLKREQREFLDTGAPYELYYELPAFVIAWCESTDESQCKQVIQDLKEQTGLFLGEFIKALLKVNAIAQELERVCELTQELELLQKLREIPALTLKYIATSQSLYI
jgi:superfamily II RNA helicase